jgi:hypothetical protein
VSWTSFFSLPPFFSLFPSGVVCVRPWKCIAVPADG